MIKNQGKPEKQLEDAPKKNDQKVEVQKEDKVDETPSFILE